MYKHFFEKNYYYTSDRDEVLYLRSLGIRYIFVQSVNDISVYKYDRLNELYQALAVLYRNNNKKIEE